jgi:hypothetical protein
MQDLEKIYHALNESPAKGAGPMLSFIQRLKIPDGEAYAEIKYIQENTNMEYGIGRSILDRRNNPSHRNGMSISEIWKIWRILSEFMNLTYFKDYEKGGKPQEQRPTGRPL